MLSIMPPREVQPSLFPLLKYRYMHTGEKAFKTLLSYFQMLNMPIPPIRRNQRSTIGAKSQPTLSIPWCWILNKIASTITATSTTISVTQKHKFQNYKPFTKQKDIKSCRLHEPNKRKYSNSEAWSHGHTITYHGVANINPTNGWQHCNRTVELSIS